MNPHREAGVATDRPPNSATLESDSSTPETCLVPIKERGYAETKPTCRTDFRFLTSCVSLCKRNIRTYRYSTTDRYTEANKHTQTNRYALANRHTSANGHTRAHRHADPDQHTCSHSNSNANFHTNSNPDFDANSNFDSRYRSGAAASDAQCA